MAECHAVRAGSRHRICHTAVPQRHLVGWCVDGHWLVLGRVGLNLFAYREICPDCGSSLVQAPVAAGVVTCAVCRHRYDLTQGGRSLDAEGAGLGPPPALRGAVGADDPGSGGRVGGSDVVQSSPGQSG